MEHRHIHAIADAHPAMLWRGALAVTSEPPELFWRGKPLGLSPAEIALMTLLVRRGRAALGDIAETLAGVGANISSLNVLTYRIRRKFAALGAPDPIEARRQWGLVLRVEPDARGSTALWIGSAEPWADAMAWQPHAAATPQREAERRF
ncbi:DNA-binding response OmpR family regulator [Sphingomonas naasensis]|uniref:OmpR/PhoB-type domain-containing protein n=1 Tax=Sphingomonas naasensis TaxID=1344951 RepID=A0A4S1WEV2_9SPHN|nr:hypothetical protein [Sphingomonas naasensis]NIJ21481.1 DNA-binding response OmpR family regulator [Sphingomonas naasensis]TGX41564.1 hypothetical protein E5A74_13190 [Sphingomonas naasensis]